MRHNAFIFIALFLFWLALSGFLKPLFLAFGVISSLLTLYVVHKMYGGHSRLHSLPRFFMRLLPYCFWLLKEVVLSAMTVAKIVWRPHMPIAPAFEWIPIGLKGDVGRAVYANSITLTPGTVTVHVRQDQFQIHALDKASLEELKSGVMEQKIETLVDQLETQEGQC